LSSYRCLASLSSRARVRASSQGIRIKFDIPKSTRTHIDSLTPIPVVMLIRYHFLPMACTHLPHNSSQPIEQCPVLLSSFSMEVAHTILIRGAETVYAVVLVVQNMEGGNHIAKAIKNGKEFR
jgi:hypothetical protein